jgi:NifU-like protein involved in Fe-S cluster formation
MSLPYSKKTIENFLNPKNVGDMDDADATATEGSPACGDMIKLYIKVDKDTKIIKDIRFRSFGCASNIAASSVVTELAKNKTLQEAKNISWEDVLNNLGGLPPVKVHCAVLSTEALKTAIENYEMEHGLIKEKIPTSPEIVKNRLKRVINPVTGKDVMSGDLVKTIDLKGGIIQIELNIQESHQFAENLKEEIKERLEPLWDIKEVNIRFVE